MIFDFHTQRRGLEKALRAYTKNAKLKIVYTKEDQPRTDGVTIWIPAPSPDWTDDEFTMWKYSGHHEGGHQEEEMIKIFKVIKDRGLDMRSFYGYVLNLLDDHRQEYHRHAELEGRRKDMAKGRGLFLETQVKGVNPDAELTDVQAAGRALFAWDSYMRVDFQKECLSAALKFLDCLDDKSLEYYNMLQVSGDRFSPRGLTAEEEYDLVRELLDYLGFNGDKEQEEGEKPKPEDGEPEEGEGDESGEGEDGDPSEDPGKYLFHSHAEDEDGEKEYCKVVPDERDSDEEYTASDVQVHKADTDMPDPYYSESIAKADGGGRAMANTIRKIMQVRSQAHYQQGLKKGKLGRNVHRTLIPNAGEYGERVFKKRVTNNTLDTALTVLVDCSGSMAGHPYVCAGRAAMMLNQALGMTPVKYSIVGFTYRRGKPEHYVFKDFGERVSEDKMLQMFASTARHMADNSDGESVLWAYDKLRQQKSNRKMIITLSDGCPCASGQPYAYEFAKRVINGIVERGDCEMYGIGIMDRTVERLYPYNSVINKADELEGALLNVIKNRILL